MIDDAIEDSIFDYSEFASKRENIDIPNRQFRLTDGTMASYKDIAKDLTTLVNQIPDEKTQRNCIDFVRDGFQNSIDNCLNLITTSIESDSYYDKVLKVKRLLTFSNNYDSSSFSKK